MYALEFTSTAEETIKKLKRNEPQAFAKLKKLLIELMNHPTVGTGHPEQLKGERTGQWSRRITQKHRLIYQIKEHEVVVLVLSAYGHYDDK
jgi:toxin YoeB